MKSKPETDFLQNLKNQTMLKSTVEILYIEENCATLPSQARAQIETLASQGKTPVLFAKDKKILGIIAVADTIKEDSAQAISELKNMGIHTLLLTGDNEITARAIAKQASHESGAVTLETAKPVDESVIKAAVEEAGYEYIVMIICSKIIFNYG